MRVQFQHILCATDFSEHANRTIPYGVAIAREFGAKLFVAHVVDLSAVAIYGEFQLDPVGQQERIARQARELLQRTPGLQDVAWEPLIRFGHPASEIARLVQEKDLDLVIAATRGHSGLKRLILGSVTQRLIRTLSCPVLAVQSPPEGLIDPERGGIRLQRLLVGIDFSADSENALRYGLSLAQEFEAEVHMLHVMEPPVYPEFLTPSEQTQDLLQVDVVKEKLEALVPQEARLWCTPRVTVLRGQPYEELVAYAVAHEMDMIVLGVRGHGLVKSLLLGSTTDRVVRRAPCPVLAVGSQALE